MNEGLGTNIFIGGINAIFDRSEVSMNDINRYEDHGDIFLIKDMRDFVNSSLNIREINI